MSAARSPQQVMGALVKEHFAAKHRLVFVGEVGLVFADVNAGQRKYSMLQ
jgi:hypothetical protein